MKNENKIINDFSEMGTFCLKQMVKGKNIHLLS